MELYALSDADKVRMLRKLALFWDGQWFLRSVDKFGLDAAVELNAAVRTAFGRIEMRTMLKALGRERGTTTVMVTHDNRILELADRIVTLEDGRIVRDEVLSG